MGRRASKRLGARQRAVVSCSWAIISVLYQYYQVELVELSQKIYTLILKDASRVFKKFLRSENCVFLFQITIELGVYPDHA